MQGPLKINNNRTEFAYVSLSISPVNTNLAKLQSNALYTPVQKSSAEPHIVHYRPTSLQNQPPISSDKSSSKISSPTNESFSVDTNFCKTNNTERQTRIIHLNSMSSPSLISHESPRKRDISLFKDQIDSLKVMEYEEFTARKNCLENRVLSQVEEPKKIPTPAKSQENETKIVNNHEVNIATKNQLPSRHQHKGRRRDNLNSRFQMLSDSSTKDVLEKRDNHCSGDTRRSKTGSCDCGNAFAARLSKREDGIEFSTENSEYSTIQTQKDPSTLLKEVELLRSILKEKEKLLSKDIKTKQSRNELLIKNNALAKENAELRTETAKLLEALKSSNEEVMLLTQDLKIQRENTNALEEKIRMIENARMQLEREKEEQRLELNSLKEKTTRVKEKKREYKKNLQILKEDYDHLTLKLSVILNANNEKKMNEEADLKIQNYILKIDNLNEVIKHQRDAIDYKDTEIDDLMEKIELLIKSIGFKDEEISTLQREISTIQEELLAVKDKKGKVRTKSSGDGHSREHSKKSVQQILREESAKNSCMASPDYKNYQPIDIQRIVKMKNFEESNQEFQSQNSDRTHLHREHSRSIEKGNNCLDTIKLKNLAFYEKEKKASKEKKSMKKSSSNRDLHLKNEKAHQSQPKLDNLMTSDSLMTEYNENSNKLNAAETIKPKPRVPIVEIEKAKILRSLNELKNLNMDNCNLSALNSSRTARKSAIQSGRVSTTRDQIRMNAMLHFNHDSNRDSVEIEQDSVIKEDIVSARNSRSKSKSSSKTKKKGFDPYSIAIVTPKPSLASVPLSRISSNTHYKDENMSAKSARDFLFKELFVGTNKGKDILNEVFYSDSNRSQPKNRKTAPNRKDVSNHIHKCSESGNDSRIKRNKKKSLS